MTTTTDLTYTWEHRHDETRYLRGERPSDVVLSVRHARDGQLGVIVQVEDGPLQFAALTDDQMYEARSVADLRRALRDLARALS